MDLDEVKALIEKDIKSVSTYGPHGDVNINCYADGVVMNIVNNVNTKNLKEIKTYMKSARA